VFAAAALVTVVATLSSFVERPVIVPVRQMWQINV
jgi:hypothetical protein